MANQDQEQPFIQSLSILPNITITNVTGDLTIDPPDNSIIIHAVNCIGQWGSGVALAIAEALPGAYKVYKDVCDKQSATTLLGSTLLIPPQKCDYDLADGFKSKRWVYCLFVSEGYGRATKSKPGKAKPAEIIRHTKQALQEVRNTLSAAQNGEMVNWNDEGNEDVAEGPDCEVVWACKFNSGSFGVKWATTLEMIKDVFEGRDGSVWKGNIRIVSPV